MGRLWTGVLSSGTDGSVDTGVERMWVFDHRVRRGMYLGVLDNEPGSVQGADGVYLARGAEVPPSVPST